MRDGLTLHGTLAGCGDPAALTIDDYVADVAAAAATLAADARFAHVILLEQGEGAGHVLLEGVNHVLKSIESMELQDHMETYRATRRCHWPS